MFVREYLITMCAYDDGDVVPVCNFAAIKPPDDCADEDIPAHVSALMRQIAEDMPNYIAAEYGIVPPPHARFWEMAPNPVELEEGAVIAPWIPAG